jgi:Acetyltransferase (GNAT) family
MLPADSAPHMQRSLSSPIRSGFSVERWNGERGAGFLAMDQDVACGIAGSFLDQDDPRRAHLIAMWTAPTHRQRGGIGACW